MKATRTPLRAASVPLILVEAATNKQKYLVTKAALKAQLKRYHPDTYTGDSPIAATLVCLWLTNKMDVLEHWYRSVR